MKFLEKCKLFGTTAFMFYIILQQYNNICVAGVYIYVVKLPIERAVFKNNYTYYTK